MTHVALVAPEGVLTSDSRIFEEGAWRWRDTVPLQFTDTTADGHDGAIHVGNASNMRREMVDGVVWIVADVEYDSDADAREAMRLADEGRIAGISADYIGSETITILEMDEFGNPTKAEIRYDDAELLGFTQLPMPAFAGARIVTAAEFQTLTPEVITAALNPKASAAWFADPELTSPTPLTVTEDGRVFGHLATWGTCHIGFDGACVTPPEGTDYRWFHTGAVRVGDEDIPVGHITLGTGHALLSADPQAAARHYDDTGTCAADVTVGEDEHGIWVAGAVRPNADLDALRSAALSGDWRRVDGKLELVAALAVNVPGFPVPRVAARVASGDQTALVASGLVSQRSRDDLIIEALRLLSQKIDALTPPGLVLEPGNYTISDVNVMSDNLARFIQPTQTAEPDEPTAGRIAAVLDATG